MMITDDDAIDAARRSGLSPVDTSLFLLTAESAEDVERMVRSNLPFCTASEPRLDPLPNEPRTELGYAHRFVTVYGDQVRYAPSLNGWFIWNGHDWARDVTQRALRWMSVIARLVTCDTASGSLCTSTDCSTALREAYQGETFSFIAGALSIAATHPELCLTNADVDAEGFLTIPPPPSRKARGPAKR